MTLTTIAISGITMYYFALDLTRSGSIALLAAFFYLTAPYRLEDIYIRGALGEALAFVFLPVFFQGLFNLFHQERPKSYLTAIGFTGLLLSHNISALMAGTAAGIYLLAHPRQLLNAKVIKSLAVNGLVVLAFSMFYLGPLLEHRFLGDYQVFIPDSMGSLAAMEAQGLSLRQLLSNAFIPEKLSFSLGLQLLIPLLFLPAAYKQLIRNKNLVLLLLLGLGSILVMSRVFPWTVMPSVFSFIQFPWRFLALAVFFLSIPCAFVVGNIYKELEIKHLLPLLLIIVVYISPILAFTANDPQISDQNFLKLDRIVEESMYSQGSAFFEYLPVKARADIPYLARRPDRALIVTGEARITNEAKQGTNLNYDIVAAVDTEIELPYLYYLGWEAAVESSQGKTKLKVFESAQGFAAVEFPAGWAGAVSVKFRGTILTRLAYLVSLISLGVFIIMRRDTFINRFWKK